MTFPLPNDPAQAPIWDNYVVAQAAQASLGIIPASTLAFGIRIDGLDVELRFQLMLVSEADLEDMDDIVSELEGILSTEVRVTRTYELLDHHLIPPDDGIRWVYMSRGKHPAG
jgi:hypothetical protein